MSTYSVAMANAPKDGHESEVRPDAADPGCATGQVAPRARDEDDVAAPVVHVAGLWRRLAAACIDLVLIAPVLGLAAFVALKVVGSEIPRSTLRLELFLELAIRGGAAFYGSVAALVVLALLYGFVFVSTVGSTPGLRWMRVRVINIYGEHPEWWRVLLRGVAGVVGLLLLGLGMLWIGFDREKRGLHDWLAGTYAIRSGVAHRA